MKKQLFAVAMLIVATCAKAEELKVADVVLPQNTTAAIAVELLNPNTVYDSFTMQIELPQGIVPEMASSGYPSFTAGKRFVDGSGISTGYKEGNIVTFARLTDGNPIQGTEGTLFEAIVKVDGEVPVGTELTATISDITFTTPDLTKETLDPVTFKITIGEPADGRIILDETSPTVPESATGVNVRVKRTINANEWSSICLPFAMTSAQMKAAFGDDVLLADFNGTDSDVDNDENVVGITVNFDEATAIEANHPYIIMVSVPVTEFTVDDVDIVADEDEACIEFDNGKTGSRRVVYSGFYGTYHAGTVLDEFTLFLSQNKFWYSDGNMKMNAFRAYFDFLDVLTSVEDAGSRITMSLGNIGTGIRDINSETPENHYYDLQGRHVENPGKGVFVKSGKKVIVK